MCADLAGTVQERKLEGNHSLIHGTLNFNEMEQAQGLIGILEQEIMRLQTSLDLLQQSNRDLKQEIAESGDEDKVYKTAIEVRGFWCFVKLLPLNEQSDSTEITT
jgi:hypothetical protein